MRMIRSLHLRGHSSSLSSTSTPPGALAATVWGWTNLENTRLFSAPTMRSLVDTRGSTILSATSPSTRAMPTESIPCRPTCHPALQWFSPRCSQNFP
ncbi:hypothetical protein B566_EDAN014063 [Ephemera danica]|nr:hypothetical protein B566_EDAN014063 [Ephemera danica]